MPVESLGNGVFQRWRLTFEMNPAQPNLAFSNVFAQLPAAPQTIAGASGTDSRFDLFAQIGFTGADVNPNARLYRVRIEVLSVPEPATWLHLLPGLTICACPFIAGRVIGSHSFQLTPGDSGGGVFRQVGGVWQLTGINIAEGIFENQNPFTSAVFGNTSYMADLSVYRSEIMTLVPEPSSLALAGCAVAVALIATARRRFRFRDHLFSSAKCAGTCEPPPCMGI
jgi:hypothetical protein